MKEMTVEDFAAPLLVRDEAVDVRALARLELAIRDPGDINEAELVHDFAAAIDSPARYAWVARMWTRLKTEIDRRKAYFRENDKTGSSRIGRAYRVYQDWLQAEHESIDALVEAERKAASLLGAYDADQRRIAEETRVRLEADARVKAEAEQFVAALDADADGLADVAAEILDAPPMVVSPSVPSQTPQVAGLNMAGKWKAELAVPGNIDKLILEAAREITQKRARIAASMLKADSVAINRQATSMKGNLKLVAGTLGLVVFEDRTPRRR